MWILVLSIVVFLSLSGLMALVDAAVLSVTQEETEELVLTNKPGAVWLKRVKNQLTRGVVVIVIVTNTINVLGPILIGQQSVALFDTSAIGPITVILTLGTILFSEIIPKSLGAHHAPTIGRLAAPAIVVVSYVLYPLVYVLEKIAISLQRGERHIGTELQIRSLVEIGRETGRIELDESQLINRAFVLNDRLARDLMTPLDQVVSMTVDSSIRAAAEIVFSSPFSRFPVFGDSADDVKGIVLSRDILTALAEGKDRATLSEFLQDAPRVSAECRSDRLLAIFRYRKIHLAIVCDEKKTIGVVTLEDVLEQLVGEIEDEKDPG